MTQFPIYFINLAARTDRRQIMESRFAALGLKAQRIEAVTPQQVPQSDLTRYCDPRRYLWQTPTEFACSLSHIAALRTFLETSDVLGFIFEDDVHISGELPAVLGELKTLSPLPDLIKLETFNDVMVMDPRPSFTVGPITLRRALSRTNGSAGYAVSRGAAALIVDSVHMRMAQADTALFNPHRYLARHLGVVHADPALCIQVHRCEDGELDSSDSQITAARASRGAIARKYRLHRDMRRLRELAERWSWSLQEYYWKLQVNGRPRRIPFLP